MGKPFKQISMKKYNINSRMYIKITDMGMSHLISTVGQEYIKNSIDPYKVIINHETWYKLQCHKVFMLFPILPYRSGYFELTVMIDDDDLEPILYDTNRTIES